MSDNKSHQSCEKTIIENEQLRLEIAKMGGEPVSLVLKQGTGGHATEFLWQGDARYWGRRAPLLFPIVGRLRGGVYLHGGREYQLGCHGFAANLPHRIEKKDGARAVTYLSSNAETLAVYPFGFELEQEFTLDGNTLHVKVKATAADELWCAFGGHPGFVLPSEDGRAVDFDSLYIKINDIGGKKVDGRTPHRQLLSPDRFIADAREDFPLDADGCFALRHELFDDDAIILCNVHSATLASNITPHRVTVTSADANYFGFWQTDHSDAPFVCMEPWQGLPADAGDANKPDRISERRLMHHLLPGASARFAFDITLE